MRSALLFISLSLFGRALAQPIDIGTGTIDLPKEFQHKRGDGFDSSIGEFTRTDGRLTVHYDIGLMAGVLAADPDKSEKIISHDERVIDGIHVYSVLYGSDPMNFIISFGDPLFANFYAAVRDDADVKVVRSLVLSFRAKKRK